MGKVVFSVGQIFVSFFSRLCKLPNILKEEEGDPVRAIVGVIQFLCLNSNVSVNSKPGHPPPPPPPPGATIGDSHILVAPGVGFSFLCLGRGLPGGLPRGGLNQSKSSIILKKARFLLCLLNN